MIDESDQIVGERGLFVTLNAVDCWLAVAQGTPIPSGPDIAESDNENELAWEGNVSLARLLTAGDLAAVPGLVEESMSHLLRAAGIGDDFAHLWPPLVEAAVAIDDLALAERLLEPVATAAPGIVAPLVLAQSLRLRGLVGAARGDDPATVEADLRTGVAALGAFGAVGLGARAEEELARWLVDQGRGDEAAQLIDRVAATYSDIGADGWLARLNAWSETQPEPHPQVDLGLHV